MTPTGDPGRHSAVPDPATATWPRQTARLTLRLVEPTDAHAMWSYRRLPEVVEFLNHDVLTLDEVRDRIASRLSGQDAGAERYVRGVSVLMGAQMVGDAMLKTLTGPEGEHQLWVGYAFHPDVWGRGVASEVVRELLKIGEELDLPVYADAYRDNVGSQRVLTRTGFVLKGRATDDDGRELLVYCAERRTRLSHQMPSIGRNSGT